MDNKRKKSKYGYRRFSGSRGTITVFVTLIMIPVILLNAFIVDMTRVKLYGDQAVMTADNVAEAALTNYDNLLKEMYGLFAMSQDKAAMDALDQIEEFVKYSSFDPNSNTMLGESYDGFMPYSTAELEFGEFTYPEGANLANPQVLQTQIGDFMRFRIVQESMQAVNGNSLEDAAELFKVLEQCLDLEADSEITEKKMELDDAISDLYVALYKYFMFGYGYAQYSDDLTALNRSMSEMIGQYKSYYESDAVRKYYQYCNLPDDEKDSDEWKNYNASAERDTIIGTCEGYRDSLVYFLYDFSFMPMKNVEILKKNDVSLSISGDHPKEYVGWYLGDIRDYGSRYSDVAQELYDAIPAYEAARDQMQVALEAKPEDDDFRKKVEKDMHDADELIGIFLDSNNGYTREDFIGLVNYLNSNSSQDSAYLGEFWSLIDKIDEFSDSMSNGVEISDTMWDVLTSFRLDESEYNDFMDVAPYKAIMDKLSSKFLGQNPDDEQKYRDKKSAADDKLKNAKKAFEDEEFPRVRNIPDGFNIPTESGTEGAFDPIGSIKEVARYFTRPLGDSVTELMLKYYTISYDFGMFTSRVSKELAGKSESELEDKDVVLESLTGVTYDGNANYMYGAELEYVFAGYREAERNLKSCRNFICGFRGIMNYKSTYTISPLNNALCTVRATGNGIFPGLGYLVEQSFRLCITALETSKDWEMLKEGKSVLFDKKYINDLSIARSLGDFFTEGELESYEEDKSDGLKLSYNQYLRLMVILFTQNKILLERTCTLITLNMNLVENGNIGANGELSAEKQVFFADKAYTAVSVDCSVHSDFAVMPQSFLNQLAGPDTVDEINDYGSSFFKFTVVRGY